jgi:DNA-binding response OmpR family regulator
MRILVAERYPALGIFLEREFGADKCAADLAVDAEAAKRLAEERDYDAAILDLSILPHDGLEVLRQVRTLRAHLPILILTAGTKPDDRAKLLDSGADDLLLRPFAFSELAARVRALLRRNGRPDDAVLRVDDLELNRVERRVMRAGRTINLTPKEFSVLECLMRSPGAGVTRSQITQHVWNSPFDTMTNVVDVYINYLRKKVDASYERKLIHTVRGVGYRVQAPQPFTKIAS